MNTSSPLFPNPIRPGTFPLTVALPEIHWLLTKFARGTATMENPDGADAMCLGPIADVLAERHQTDAHFVAYRVFDHRVGRFEEKLPRLRKEILPALVREGAEVVLTSLVVDVGNPDHRLWQPGEFAKFRGGLDGNWPTGKAPTFLYPTRGGARFIFVLAEPIEAGAGEMYLRELVRQFRVCGVNADPAATDWTRMFRLPYVIRDGLPTLGARP